MFIIFQVSDYQELDDGTCRAWVSNVGGGGQWVNWDKVSRAGGLVTKLMICGIAAYSAKCLFTRFFSGDSR